MKELKLRDIPDEYKIVCILSVGNADEEITRVSKKALESRAWFDGLGA